MAPGPLNGVVALSANEAWAVGNTAHGQGATTRPARSLIERWDGVQWAQVPSPNAGPGDNILYAVDALSSNDIWAVGGYALPGSEQYVPVLQTPLVLRWDGVEWSVVPMPALDGQARLYAVEAIAPDDVWAVGSRSAAKDSKTLALHWDGTTWHEVPTPDPEEGISELRGVAALTSDDIWAVGTYSGNLPNALDPGGSYDIEAKTLALHWNGREWTHVPTPYVEQVKNGLDDLVPLAPNDIWAIGSWWGGEGGDPITLHWNGKEWALIPSPKGLAHNGTGLYAVAPLSPGDVWGVGSIGGFPFLLHWDGNSWANVRPPDLSLDLGFGWLRAASISPDGDIWAVGNAQGEAAAATLRYSRTGCAAP
jgi:hypothetical protein